MGEVTISGTRLLYDGESYYYQGLTCFNALFNKSFNAGEASIAQWLDRYRAWGITALRVWCDWRVTNGWVDEGADASLWIYPAMEGRNRIFEPEGCVAQDVLARLKRLLTLADKRDMVIELALFTHYLVYPVSTRDDYVTAITEELKPWRNTIFQVWNEYDDHTLRHMDTIKSIDPERLVTNSPGYPGALGTPDVNRTLDLLTPHTYRHGRLGDFWEVAPRQIKELIETYQKPVIDDEPARTGIRDFGGNPESRTEQHLKHIDAVRACGGYHHYHHDMFQSGYGAPTTPPHGVADPGFSPFHRPIFEYLRDLAPAEVRGG